MEPTSEHLLVRTFQVDIPLNSNIELGVPIGPKFLPWTELPFNERDLFFLVVVLAVVFLAFLLRFARSKRAP